MKSFKTLLAITVALGLVACSKPESTVEPVVSVDTTDEAIYQFGQNLFQKIQADEKMLTEAFQNKDVKRIENYSLYEWHEYINKPYGPEEEKMEFGHRYFPSSNKASVYTVCDTAFGDLNLLAGTMVHVLEEPANGSFQKIYKQEFEDYSKSKAECQARVSLSFDDAVRAYEND